MSSRGPYRRHAPEFKIQPCQDIRSGAIGRRDAARKYTLSTNLIQLWLTQYDRGELSTEEAEALYNDYVATQASSGTVEGLAAALHAVEDSAAGGHKGFQAWSGGLPSSAHMHDDWTPSPESVADAINKATELLRQYGGKCECQ
jgi:transposase-like protein